VTLKVTYPRGKSLCPGEKYWRATFDPMRLRDHGCASRFNFGATFASNLLGETKMAWKTPKIVEVPVGMEINMYACAARK
jgi:coenzyme PQQ precursor peptide PqqA